MTTAGLAVGARLPGWLSGFLPDELAGSMLNPIVFAANIILLSISNGINQAILPPRWDSLELPLDISGLDILHHWDHTTMGRDASRKLHGTQIHITGNDSVVFNNEYLDNVEGWYYLYPPVS